MTVRHIHSANDVFQHVETLKTNRAKRTKHGEFVVEGVLNIERLLGNGWTVRQLWYAGERRLSDWAKAMMAAAPRAQRVETTAELMARLSDRTDPSELVAVAKMRDDASQLAQLTIDDATLILALDRPSSPGNVGSMVRSADALGATAVVITGHAADPYDPQAVRASMGSLFGLPVIRLTSNGPLLDLRKQAPALRVVGGGAPGGNPVDRTDLRGPLMVVMGNEADGLSQSYREACDVVAHIPMTGTADSLNVAAAATVLLYEVSRQRRAAPPLQ